MPPKQSPQKPLKEHPESSTVSPGNPVPRAALNAAQRAARDAAAYARKAGERAQYAAQTAHKARQAVEAAKVGGEALEAVEAAERAANAAFDTVKRYRTQASNAVRVVTRIANLGRPAPGRAPRTEREAELEAEVAAQKRRIAELEEAAEEGAALDERPEEADEELPVTGAGSIAQEVAQEIEGESLVSAILEWKPELEFDPSIPFDISELPEDFPAGFREFAEDWDGEEFYRMIAEYSDMDAGEIYTLFVSPEVGGASA